jgi:phage shock protein A
MQLFKRAVDIVRANLSELLSKAEDPEKMLNLYLQDAREHLQEARTAVHDALTAQNEVQSQYDKLNEEVAHWAKRAEQAVQKGADDLAREALVQKKKADARLESLKEPLAQTKAQAQTAREQLHVLEEKISEAEAKRGTLIARARMAQASKKTAETLASISSTDPLAGMSSMEAKIQHMEAEAKASGELLKTHRDDLEEKFQELEGGSSVDDELAALKAKHAPKPPESGS